MYLTVLHCTSLFCTALYLRKSRLAWAGVALQVCINSAMMSMVKSLNGFSRERQVVLREMSKAAPLTRGGGRGGYGIGPYFLAKLAVETPMDAAFS
eukprot:2003342-Pyramimonas_sp.AAC.1